MKIFIALSPLLLIIGMFLLGISSLIISEKKDIKKLELDSAKNYVDISRIFSRIITYLPLLESKSLEMRNLKNKIESLDAFVRKLNNGELSQFKVRCIDEMPALLKIQKVMLTPKFNNKNGTLIELIELVIDNLEIHRKEYEAMMNIDLKVELESLKGIKAKRKKLIDNVNKS